VIGRLSFGCTKSALATMRCTLRPQPGWISIACQHLAPSMVGGPMQAGNGIYVLWLS
jgi:hypothetical protein